MHDLIQQTFNVLMNLTAIVFSNMFGGVAMFACGYVLGKILILLAPPRREDFSKKKMVVVSDNAVEYAD